MERFSYRWRARLVRQVLIGLLAVGVVTVPFAGESRAATSKTDPREKRARQAFAAGRYTEALDLFATLYGDTVHPTYLRNIGRCYQNLKQPEKAINAFKDYLRLAKGLTVAEKREIEAYIAEMEAMKRQEDSTSSATPTASESASQTTTPLPTPSPARIEPTTSAGTTLTQAAQPAPVAEEDPFYKRGWFWGVVGGVVVVGVVGALVATGAFSHSSSDQCSGRVCVNLGEMR